MKKTPASSAVRLTEKAMEIAHARYHDGMPHLWPDIPLESLDPRIMAKQVACITAKASVAAGPNAELVRQALNIAFSYGVVFARNHACGSNKECDGALRAFMDRNTARMVAKVQREAAARLEKGA